MNERINYLEDLVHWLRVLPKSMYLGFVRQLEELREPSNREKFTYFELPALFSDYFTSFPNPDSGFLVKVFGNDVPIWNPRVGLHDRTSAIRPWAVVVAEARQNQLLTKTAWERMRSNDYVENLHWQRNKDVLRAARHNPQRKRFQIVLGIEETIARRERSILRKESMLRSHDSS